MYYEIARILSISFEKERVNRDLNKQKTRYGVNFSQLVGLLKLGWVGARSTNRITM